MARLATLLSIISAASVSANTLLATLDYGSFQGYYDAEYNLSYWRKIPFAAPPVGENRFRAPQPPLQVNGTYDTNAGFSECPQRTANGSEDCLYLGVYARPWSEGQKLRPVFVEMYGGAFVEGSASTGLPGIFYPLLNSSDESDFIAVGPNYRVNAFGFLPGQEIYDDPLSDLNPGLLDQQYALQWVHRYIHLFGGDPSQVTIIGQSAGGGSTVAQSIANGGKTDPPLFQRALSLSPFWPKTYQYNSPQAQAIYDQFASLANCSGTSNTLECLKSADLDTLITAAYGVTYGDEYGPNSYTWAPVIDGTFLPNTLSDAVEKGAINAPAHWGMYNTYEGENFIPSGLKTSDLSPYNSSDAAFELWLGDFLPDLSQSDLDHLLTVYPSSGSSESIESYNTTYIRAELIYRDLVLACPGYWLAQSAKVGYLGQYTISPATHGSDTSWWDSYGTLQTEYPTIYEGFAGAYASFIQTGDPNKNKLTNSSEAGVPEINTGDEWIIALDGFTVTKLEQLKTRFRTPPSLISWYSCCKYPRYPVTVIPAYIQSYTSLDVIVHNSAINSQSPSNMVELLPIFKKAYWALAATSLVYISWLGAMTFPTVQRAEHEELLNDNWSYGPAEDYTQTVAYKLLSEEPNSRVVTNFHGNAAHLGSVIRPEMYRMALGVSTPQNPVHVFAIDYRGYGISTGSPSEEGLITDGVTLLNFLTSEPCNIPPSQIVIAGLSLGTAVTTAVAERFAFGAAPDSPDSVTIVGQPALKDPEPFAGIILVASFSNLPDLIESYSFKGLTPPMLSPLAGYPRAREWVKSQILDTWQTNSRLARLTSMKPRGDDDSAESDARHAQKGVDITIIHARDDAEIPWKEGFMNWKWGTTGWNNDDDKQKKVGSQSQVGKIVYERVAEDGVTETRVWEKEIWPSPERSTSFAKTNSNGKGVKRVRWEKVGYGGHNQVGAYSVAALAILRSFEE
ncbi:hypothetical protein UA08_00130 [Talaromyces atroroseus]|uniref:Carboxylesterase type B domain-containing protein n=1 Tax=Talaromyces atroroseus TaxID=1441469 RepID=A0A225BCC3_TALAT|nr:hypothetical protein UA08_00130 [Talaromyces atroroseus]OKL64565.1 hypothetical protein UA08_00130 [Talaromyces atroroseus]